MASSESWRNPPPAPQLDEFRSRMPQPDSLIPAWLRAWWPAILCAIIMSAFSTDTFSAEHTGSVLEAMVRGIGLNLTVRQFDLIHHLIRKGAHFTEYFIFYLLVYRGIRGARIGWRWSWALSAWLIAAFYSGLDEIHQSFVASRTASVWDSMLDSTGALMALLALFLFFRLWRSRRTEQFTS